MEHLRVKTPCRWTPLTSSECWCTNEFRCRKFDLVGPFNEGFIFLFERIHSYTEPVGVGTICCLLVAQGITLSPDGCEFNAEFVDGILGDFQIFSNERGNPHYDFDSFGSSSGRRHRLQGLPGEMVERHRGQKIMLVR